MTAPATAPITMRANVAQSPAKTVAGAKAVAGGVVDYGARSGGATANPATSGLHEQLTQVGNVTTFAIARTAADFNALERDWKALEQRLGTGCPIFQTFDWLALWVRHFVDAETQTLCVVTVRRDGEIVCALPLVVETAFGLRALAFMGAPLSQYGDALVIPGVDRVALVRQALTLAVEEVRPALVRLAKVREDAAVVPYLGVAGARETSHDFAPYIDLATHGSFEAYQKRFSAKKLKNLRRLKRRLEERGPTAFNWQLRGQPAADAITLGMVMKRAWLRQRGLMSRAFSDKRFEAFFADATREGVQSGVEVATLTTAGETANTLISVNQSDVMALHVIAYSLKHERSSAGTLHVEAVVEEAFRRGVKTIDFLAPRHDYKDEWADGAVRVSDYAMPVTLAGAIYARVYLGVLREVAKKIAAITPQKVRVWLLGKLQRRSL